MNRVSIIGLGWFGEALAEELKTQYKISGTTRSEEKVAALRSQGIHAEKLTLTDLPSPQLLSADTIVLNIPPFPGQLGWLKSWKWNKKTHVIFISSTSVYGKNTGLVDETTIPIPETGNANVLLEEEEWIKTFEKFTIVRFAGLIGGSRHPGNTLSGRQGIAGGNLPINLIHLKDCVGFIKLLIDKNITNETYNLANPTHPTRRDYYQSYCLKHHLTLPEFIDSPEGGKIISHHKASLIYKFVGDLN
jgi:nucleoside-diphosphate-sugar epimerase